jgi:hypothetical protein
MYFPEGNRPKSRSSVSGGTTVEAGGKVSRPQIQVLRTNIMRKARKKIEAIQVEELAFIGSTLFEMAICLNCSEYTLYRRFHKAIERGIVCRTIFLKRQRLYLAMKGNAAALKRFRDAWMSDPNERLKHPKCLKEEASRSQEEWNERILDKVKCQQEWLDKHPEIQQSLLAIRARLQTKYAPGLG